METVGGKPVMCRPPCPLPESSLISQHLRHGGFMNRIHEMLIFLLRGLRPRVNDKYPELYLMINLIEVSGEPREPPPDELPSETPEGHGGPHGAATGGGDADMRGPDADTGADINMDFVGSMELHDNLGTLEPALDDEISNMLLLQMGSSGRAYRREKASAAKKIVSEIYSPPRMTALMRQLKSRHYMPGYAFDLTMIDPEDGKPWDFSLAHKRERAR